MVRSTCIIGWGHTQFGRNDQADLEELIVEATRSAINDAGIDPVDIDAIYLGHFNGGLIRDSFVSSLVMQADDRLRFKPSTRVENACASGAAAVFEGLRAIDAGHARTVLVVGAEKMTSISGKQVTDVLASASYVKEEAARGMTFPGLFAGMAETYFDRFGDHRATLARIAAKNHANGALNPIAHIRRDLGFDFCNTVGDKNPIVAAPLRKTDCSTVSDGAAALIITNSEMARSFPRKVAFRAFSHVNDYLPMVRRNPILFEGPKLAWTQALSAARINVTDLSLAEVHDCFTIAELLIYEAMGLAESGCGSKVIDEGISALNGRLLINPSGGLKAKGHPIGATGVSMHVLAAMQLVGEAGGFQVPNASLAGVFNMGGSAVANYVSILEAC